jgi:hypothetical protein
MKFVEPGPFADPDAAARKVMELANAFEPVQEGRIYIEKINEPFLYRHKGTTRRRWALCPVAGHGPAFGRAVIPWARRS